MKIKKIATAIALASALIATSAPTFAQSPSPSPSPSPSASPSPTPTPTPTPSPSPSASPSSQPETGGTTKEEVLGDSTTLGETNQQREVAKWLIAGVVGIGSFLLVIKTVKSAQE